MWLCVKHTGVFVTFLFLTVCGPPASAQEYQVTHFTVEDGLPSPETYFVHEDIHGYIWIGTDRGLCRYDGYEFTNFNTGNSGLTNNTVFKCYEAPNHDLWFTCYDGSISIYKIESRRFEPFEFNDSLQTWFSYWPSAIKYDESNVIITGLREGDVYAIFNWQQSGITKKELQIDEIHQIRTKNGVFDLYFHYPTKNSVIAFAPNYKKTNSESNLIIDNSYTFDGTVYFHFQDNLYFFERGRITQISEINDEIHSIQVVGDRLYVCTSTGVQVYRCCDFAVSAEKIYLLNPTYVGVSIENGLWVSTLRSGVSYYHNYLRPPVSTVDLNAPVTALANFKGALVVGTSQEQVYILRDQQPRLLIDTYSGLRRPLPIERFNISFGRLTTPGGFLLTDTNNLVRLKTRSLTSQSLIISEQRYLSIPYVKGFVIHDSINWEVHRDVTPRVVSLYKQDSTVIMGTISGAFVLNLRSGTLSRYNFTKRSNKTRISDICGNRTNLLAIGMAAGGVFITGPEGNLSITTAYGLLSNIVNCVKFENDSILWVGTNKGLSKVLIAKDLRRSRVLYSLNTDDGLVSDFIYAIEFWRNKIWMGTDKGLISVPLSYTPNQVPPRLNIEKLIIDNTWFNPTKKSYRWQQQELSIKFVGISFNKPEKGFYRYRLHRLGDERPPYHYTNNTTASFNNLTKGKYVFEINCKNKNNVWSETHSYTFRVSPHWTQSLFMYIVLCLLGLWFALFLLRWRSKVIKRQTLQSSYLRELEMKFAESEVALLRNQMNPHFVFNALNSIQSFVLERDIHMASDYISRFSKLMRSSLNYSRKDFIPLEQEISFLESYMKIEKLRFPSRFDFKVRCTENVDVDDLDIPPLLLQPLVENSVKHAFDSETVGGFITVTFDQNEEYLICVIEDNGLGFLHSQSSTREKHVSIGLDVIQSRLLLIYNEGDEAFMDIDDLTNIGEGTGTRVTIKLPIA